MNCVESVTFSIFFNGFNQRKFKPSRELRQGTSYHHISSWFAQKAFLHCFRRRNTKWSSQVCILIIIVLFLLSFFFANDNLLFFQAKGNNWRVIKRVLEMYEKALGQTINIQKSIFVGSKNTTTDMIQVIKDGLGINYTTILGQYLSLPSQISKNKSDVFRFLKDRVWKVLQGRKERSYPE